VGLCGRPSGKHDRMAFIGRPTPTLRHVGRVAHSLGLAGLLGGNLFGRLALHPSVTEISDARERGKVVNTAWRRYGAVNSLSLAAVAFGWGTARAEEGRDVRLSPGQRRLAVARDALVGLVGVTGIAAAVAGIRFSRIAPGGAVPLEDGDHTAPGAPEAARKVKRELRVLGLVGMVCEAALVGVNAELAEQHLQTRRRRPALRLPANLR
jgi:hypothetical protein